MPGDIVSPTRGPLRFRGSRATLMISSPCAENSRVVSAADVASILRQMIGCRRGPSGGDNTGSLAMRAGRKFKQGAYLLVLLGATIALPTGASAISVDVAKKCNAMLAK